MILVILGLLTFWVHQLLLLIIPGSCRAQSLVLLLIIPSLPDPVQQTQVNGSPMTVVIPTGYSQAMIVLRWDLWGKRFPLHKLMAHYDFIFCKVEQVPT
jgi:hypothetical protein